MAEKKYIAVRPEDGTTNDLVNMTNPKNKFIGELVSVNPNNKDENLDVRDLFVAHIEVDGKNLPAHTQDSRRIVDISPHVNLTPVSVDGSEVVFGGWECVPGRTPSGDPSESNPHPDKKIELRLNDHGKWVGVLVLQEADEEHGVEEIVEVITSQKGDDTSMNLMWLNEEIDYGDMDAICASRNSYNLLGYRLGEENGLNEGKLLQPAAQEGSDEPFFTAWKNGYHSDGLCAGDGAKAYEYDYEHGKKVKIEGAIAFGKNAVAAKPNAVQIGEGTNDQEDTLQFKEWQLLDSEGHIPNERLVVDGIPTEGSDKPVSSGGVYNEVERIDSTISELEEHIEEEVSRIDSTISDLREYTDDRFDQVDSTISQFKDDVDDKFNQVDSTISNLQEHVDDEVERLDGGIRDLREYADGRFDEVDSTISNLQDHVG